MKCVLPAVNVKLFAKAVHCLAKIGTEIYFEPLESGLALKTVNSPRSAYVCFLFLEPMFQTYSLEQKDNDTLSEDGDGGFRCKVAVKTMLQVFKSLSTIERSVESCDINFDDKECKLVFQLKCRHGITKTHHLTFQECETLQAVFAKDLSPNMLKCEHKLLSDVAVNFSTGLEEISMSVAPCQISLKSFVNDEDENSKIMRTEMTLNPEEFSDFQVGVDTEVTFCLKDLRAILAFCDVAGTAVEMHFEVGGKPLIISTEEEHIFRANFVLATVANDEDEATQKIPEPRAPASNNTLNRTSKPRTTSKKQQARPTASRKPIPKPVNSNFFKNGHAAHSDAATSMGANSRLDGEVSPEIPDQNVVTVDLSDEPSYKRVRSVFFEASQNLPDHSIVVLAPDSDEEIG